MNNYEQKNKDYPKNNNKISHKPCVYAFGLLERNTSTKAGLYVNYDGRINP